LVPFAGVDELDRKGARPTALPPIGVVQIKV
jgi:hypothetical protein